MTRYESLILYIDPDKQNRMAESLKLILIFIPLLAGAIAIFLAYQLMRKYNLAFVSSYFYYLVFLYIFGAYSLIGAGILENLLISMKADPHTIRSSRIFATLPGIPLLSLSLYALIRSFTEVLSRKIWKIFTIVYFILFFLGLVLYGIWVVRLSRLEQGNYPAIYRNSKMGFLRIAYGYLPGIISDVPDFFKENGLSRTQIYPYVRMDLPPLHDPHLFRFSTLRSP